MTKEYVFKGKPWEPWIHREDEIHYLNLPVESGFASLSFNIPITKNDVNVILSSRERYYFLFSVLHRRFQLGAPNAQSEEVREILSNVLHSEGKAVEKYLRTMDKVANGAISNLINIKINENLFKFCDQNWVSKIEPWPKEI